MAMRDPYRTEQVEDGVQNVILQNRCGNRLTALVRQDATELEFVYKPNAFRRAEFRARNFSNRDNYTALFARSELPEIGAGMVQEVSYDPFLTVLATRSAGGAENDISLLNVADENLFALSASRPLLLAFVPHGAFVAEDGLLYEEFADRGEQIVSFVAFEGFERNRYRMLADGRHVMQIMQDEVVLVGGEESVYQMGRVLDRLGGMDREELIAHTEAAVRPLVSRGRLDVQDDRVGRVAELNRRLLWSGLDAGGACFGALNRIYYLIWFRDGAISASHMARAGDPGPVRVWAPFALANPSEWHEWNGRRCPEYLQMVGSPWTKREDDGLYYAVLSAFSAYRSTADDRFVRPALLETLTDAVDYHVATRWDDELALFGSDTVGETTLGGSEQFGYDSVDGSMETGEFHRSGAAGFARAHTLYHNCNMYNVFRMMQVLLAEGGSERNGAFGRYGRRADELAGSIRQNFLDEDTGHFLSSHMVHPDGKAHWRGFGEGDFWEYAWAVSTGPFFPDLNAAVRSARMVRQDWPQAASYGYCPWNAVAALLSEFGMGSEQFRDMLSDEVAEALQEGGKYPMQGALPERHGEGNRWRGLPFSAATFLSALAGQVLKGLPMGVAVRASDLVTGATDFTFRGSRIRAASTGQGDTVAEVAVNGRPLEGSLQLPEARLRTGMNRVEIVRGQPGPGPRLFASDARLLEVRRQDGGLLYRLASPVPSQLIFEGLPDPAALEATDA
ncbi:MAG: hypothetical protein R6V05_08575, partial [Candidatus Brocadiia bacterium]